MSTPRLTIDQFIAELREKTEREGTKWYVTPIGRLRTSGGYGECPLMYVTGQRYAYEQAAHAMGMTRPDVSLVIDAADNPHVNIRLHQKVRAQLLAATGAANV
jgi:hypothetical protein